jgi:disulfide bond formation protein DsbB
MPFGLTQPKAALLLLASISALTLLAVFTLEYLGGLAPCQMCIWQRWPFAILFVLGLAGAASSPRLAVILAVPVLIVSIGLAGYHVAVEEGWLALPAGCAAGADASSVAELKALLAEAPPSCDQVDFKFLGLSLAAWNLTLSTVLAAFALFVAISRAGVGIEEESPA